MRHFIIEMMTAPSSPLSCCIYAPIYAALGSVLLFLLERKRTRQSSSLKKYMYILQSKIPRVSLSLSQTPRRGEGAKAERLQRGCRRTRRNIWPLIQSEREETPDGRTKH